MNFSAERPLRVGFWAIILVGILAWAPATYPGYWQALDGFVPVFNIGQTSSLATVATAADRWRGSGSGATLMAQPLLLVGLPPVAATRALFALYMLLGGLGVYAWLRFRFGDRGAGLAGVVYLFLPVCLATVYIRGSLADATILALLPLALAATAAYAATDALATAGLLVIALLWMWRAQAGLALLATILLLLYALLVERHRLAGLVVAAAGAAGLTAMIPLWSVEAPPPVNFGEHFVYLFQLFANRWETAPSIAGWQDRYPFQLGLTAVMFSVSAFWLWRRARRSSHRDSERGRLLWFCYGGVLLLVLFALGPSAPLWSLLHADRLLSYPWQILLLTAPLLAATAGSLVTMNEALERPVLWTVLLLLTVLGSVSYLRADFTGVTPPDAPYAVLGKNDLIVLNALLTAAPEQQSATLDVTWQALRPLEFDANIFFQAVVDDNGSPRIVSQLDTQPAGEERPATTWQAGEIFKATYRLELPAQTPGALSYYFGFYDWRDGVRLPVDGGITDKLVFYAR